MVRELQLSYLIVEDILERNTYKSYAKCLKAGLLTYKPPRYTITDTGRNYLYKKGELLYVYPERANALKMLMLTVEK